MSTAVQPEKFISNNCVELTNIRLARKSAHSFHQELKCTDSKRDVDLKFIYVFKFRVLSTLSVFL